MSEPYPSQDRNEAFNEGHAIDPESGITNTNVSAQGGTRSSTFTPNGANMLLGPVGTKIGNSERDSERQTFGAERPAQNGKSLSSYQSLMPIANSELGASS
jgi:hypothetical protein